MPEIRVALAGSGLGVAAIVAVFTTMVALLGNPQSFPTPLGGWFVPWSMMSGLVPMTLFALWGSPLSRIERVSDRGRWPPIALRLGAAGILVVVVTALVAVMAPANTAPVSGGGSAAWRNAAAMSGIALAAGAWLSSTYAWIPGIGYLLFCYVVPNNSQYDPPAAALLFQARGEYTVVGVAVLAVGLFIAWLGLRRPTG